jgi:hypothetical protein
VLLAETTNNGNRIQPLACVLPSGKKLTLKIVVGSGRTTSKLIKVEKQKSKTQGQSPPPNLKGQNEKAKDTSASFFDKFLLVCE